MEQRKYKTKAEVLARGQEAVGKTLGEIDLIAVTAAQIGLHLTKFLAVLLAAHI